MTHFRIVEWHQYQHYRHRDPPWIKLHRNLLASRTWVMLADADKALAVACMLLAAGCDNKIPYDPAYIKRAGYLEREPDLTVLERVGFIEIIGKKPDRASTRYHLQADACQSRVELETEQRREDTPPVSPPRGRPAKGTRLPDDWFAGPREHAFAKSEGLTNVQIVFQAEQFRDHWHQSVDKSAVKRDWLAAWRTWVRKAKQWGRLDPAPAPTKGNGHWEQRDREANEAILGAVESAIPGAWDDERSRHH